MENGEQIPDEEIEKLRSQVEESVRLYVKNLSNEEVLISRKHLTATYKFLNDK